MPPPLRPLERYIPIVIDCTLDNIHISEQLIFDVYGTMSPLDLANTLALDYGLSPLAQYRLQRMVTAQAAPDCRPLFVRTRTGPSLIRVHLNIIIDGINMIDSFMLDINNPNLDLYATADRLIRERALVTTALGLLKWRKAIVFQTLQAAYRAAEIASKQLDGAGVEEPVQCSFAKVSE